MCIICKTLMWFTPCVCLSGMHSTTHTYIPSLYDTRSNTRTSLNETPLLIVLQILLFASGPFLYNSPTAVEALRKCPERACKRLTLAQASLRSMLHVTASFLFQNQAQNGNEITKMSCDVCACGSKARAQANGCNGTGRLSDCN